MFPELTPAQIERIASIGERREIRAGEMLFDIGDQNARFFVVLSGAVDIVRPVGDREEPVTAHGPGQFTGEINMLSARRSLVRARVAADGTVRPRSKISRLRPAGRPLRTARFGSVGSTAMIKLFPIESLSPSTETIYVPLCSATRR